MPRRLTEFQHYKASEYHNFILFFSIPALSELLPDKYLQHWILLVKEIFILLQEQIPKDDVAFAQKLLMSFVKQIPTLYIDRQLTYNVHQLLHLGLVVERWGPLWATSAFPFENFNGFLAHCVHGNKNLGQEMVNNLKILQGMQILTNQVADRSVITTLRQERDRLTGTVINITLDAAELELLSSHDIKRDDLFIYGPAYINNVLYTSTFHKVTKTNSYTVCIHLGSDFVMYGGIRLFFRIEQKLYLILNLLSIEHGRIFCNAELNAKISHILPVKNLGKLKLITIDSVKYITHCIRVGNYLCKRPNSFNKVM